MQRQRLGEVESDVRWRVFVADLVIERKACHRRNQRKNRLNHGSDVLARRASAPGTWLRGLDAQDMKSKTRTSCEVERMAYTRIPFSS